MQILLRQSKDLTNAPVFEDGCVYFPLLFLPPDLPTRIFHSPASPWSREGESRRSKSQLVLWTRWSDCLFLNQSILPATKAQIHLCFLGSGVLHLVGRVVMSRLPSPRARALARAFLCLLSPPALAPLPSGADDVPVQKEGVHGKPRAFRKGRHQTMGSPMKSDALGVAVWWLSPVSRDGS